MTIPWLLSQVPAAPAAGGGTLLIIGLITAICSGGGLVALIQWLANRGKSSAEEAEIWTKASVSRLKSMHEEMGTLEGRVRTLNEELEQERRVRLATLRKLDTAITLLRQHGVQYETLLNGS